MSEGLIEFFDPIKDKMQGVIKVIGVGGGGLRHVVMLVNHSDLPL